MCPFISVSFSQATWFETFIKFVIVIVYSIVIVIVFAMIIVIVIIIINPRSLDSFSFNFLLVDRLPKALVQLFFAR